MMYFDLHRHGEASSFDGFEKPKEAAKIAKELGYKALGLSDHGNTHSLVKHYFACRDADVKPILGVESYFLPVHKEKTRGYHLCIFAKNKIGYGNMNRLQFEGEKQKYYNSILDFKLLDKFSEGIICTNACVAGYISQALVKGNKKQAIKAAEKFKQIFGDDFYLEIQPYIISDDGVQEQLNYDLYVLGKKLGIKCIPTSDSHYGRKEDFDTYLLMHEMAKHNLDHIETTYQERYMPSEEEVENRFLRMHSATKNGNAKWSIPSPKRFLREMLENLDELQDKVEEDILGQLEGGLPHFGDEHDDSKEAIKKLVIKGLKARGKYNKEYVQRAKEELDTIFYHNFEDYFLMVADYVNFAKDQGIAVGPGRGSGCNCLINYALNITDVDPILFKLDFNRFLGKDKKGMPDIDVDFERDRRDEVIEYLLDKYPDNSAQICSYGLYQVDNLVNDLAKVTGMQESPGEIANIKRLIKTFKREDDEIDVEKLLDSPEAQELNERFYDIVLHFSKLYHKMRFVGTHAAGVAISKFDITNYTSIRIDSKTCRRLASYDLYDLEHIGVEKFDILGLSTMSSISELRQMTKNEGFKEEWIHDEKILKAFDEGDADGVFQFDKAAAQSILRDVGVDSFSDVVASSAMNRPGPLMLKMPKQYRDNKQSLDVSKTNSPYSEYLEESYGSLIYQEQVLAIATNVGGLDMKDARLILKMNPEATSATSARYQENYNSFLEVFIKGAKSHGLKKEEAKDLFDSFFTYSFNKGHAVGYSLISLEEMFYKVYHPAEYWYAKMRYANDDSLRVKFKINAAASGTLMFLPHVNYSVNDSLRKVEGEAVIQEGLCSIKGVGEKAAAEIEAEKKANGIFTSYDDFYDRCKSRIVNVRVLRLLKENGALEFDRKKYIGRVTKYNSTLYAKSLQR